MPTRPSSAIRTVHAQSALPARGVAVLALLVLPGCGLFFSALGRGSDTVETIPVHVTTTPTAARAYVDDGDQRYALERSGDDLLLPLERRPAMGAGGWAGFVLGTGVDLGLTYLSASSYGDDAKVLPVTGVVVMALALLFDLAYVAADDGASLKKGLVPIEFEAGETRGRLRLRVPDDVDRAFVVKLTEPLENEWKKPSVVTPVRAGAIGDFRKRYAPHDERPTFDHPTVKLMEQLEPDAVVTLLAKYLHGRDDQRRTVATILTGLPRPRAAAALDGLEPGDALAALNLLEPRFALDLLWYVNEETFLAVGGQTLAREGK